MRTCYLWSIVLCLLIGDVASDPICETGDDKYLAACNKLLRSWYERKDYLFQKCYEQEPDNRVNCNLRAERQATQEFQDREVVDRSTFSASKITIDNKVIRLKWQRNQKS
ncbi:hypothetical protein KR215_011174 [Drosophila sulfurigaster]|nr:hypothetical protein KR215_011174 [Drosophila sulfurigaster]